MPQPHDLHHTCHMMWNAHAAADDSISRGLVLRESEMNSMWSEDILTIILNNIEGKIV